MLHALTGRRASRVTQPDGHAGHARSVPGSATDAMLLPACFGRDDGAIACVLESLRDARWNALIDQALRHGVAPLLWERLTKLNVAAPPRTLERLQESYLHNELRNTTVLDELSRVFASLRRAEIPVIALKGAHLATAVYRDQALRPMADVDLLVPATALEKAQKTLREMGYTSIANPRHAIADETHHHLPVLFKTAAIPIEIHRSIVPVNCSFRIDLEGMWARARLVSIAGIDVLVFAPDDLVHHLCLHTAYNHRFDIPLLSLCDIAVALEHYRDEIDWPRFVATANAQGTSRFVYCSLMLVQLVLGAEIPLALQDLQHKGTDRAVLLAARDCVLSAGIDIPAVYQDLGNHQGFRSKARLLLQSIYPSRERLREMYDLPLESRAIYWHYLLRPIDLLRRRGRITMEMALGTRRLRPTLDRIEKRRVIDRWIDGVLQADALVSDR